MSARLIRARGRALLGLALLGAGVGLLGIAADSGAAPLAARSSPGAPPAAVAPSPPALALGSIDFGIVVGERVLEGELRARNEDGHAWSIAKSWVDCGCTRILSIEPEVVDPGAELVVRVSLDTTGRRAGPQDRDVHVLVGPEGRELRGRVRLYLVQRPEAASSSLDAEVAPGEDEFRARTVLIVPDLGLASSVVPGTAPEGVELEIGPAEAEDGVLRYPLLISGRLEPGETRRSVRLTSRVFVADHYRDGVEVAIDVHARRREPLTIHPSRLVLRRATDGANARLFVRGPGGAAPAALDLRVDPPGLLRAAYDPAEGCIDLTLELEGPAAIAAARSASISVEEPVSGARREIPVVLLDE